MAMGYGGLALAAGSGGLDGCGCAEEGRFEYCTCFGGLCIGLGPQPNSLHPSGDHGGDQFPLDGERRNWKPKR